MNRQSTLAFLVSAVASALIWAVSPLLTGHAEPWDADGLFYVACLVVAGLGAGAARGLSLFRCFYRNPATAKYMT